MKDRLKLFAIYLYGQDRGPLPAHFETLAEQLQVVDRLYFELDGSFVWTGDDAGIPWQLDGMVYDAAGQVQYIDLKGWCPFSNWKRLVDTIANGKADSASWSVVQMPAMSECKLDAFEADVWV